MSKPVKKWEVIVGKYLGIVLSAALAVVILGAMLSLATWWRIPADYQLQANALDDRVRQQITDLRWMHTVGLLPSLVLVWLQVSVLAAIGVALSTRFSLVVNLPTVILFYIAGNLTRFLFPLDKDASFLNKTVAQVVAALLPFLQVFDLRSHTIYREVAVPWTEYGNPAKYPAAIHLSLLASYVGVAALYAIGYATFALASGLILFQNRELGGAEG
jgi:hypothetical protein